MSKRIVRFADSRLESLRVVDPVLTGIAQGYEQAELIGEKIFPQVLADKEAGKIVKFGKEAFRADKRKRAIRTPYPRADRSKNSAPFVMDEDGREELIDDREVNEDSGNLLDLERGAVEAVMGVIGLNHEVDCASVALDEANYGTDNKIDLSAGGSLVPWDAASDSTPIQDIEAGKEVIRQAIAKRPNTLVLGASVYACLKQHSQLLERFKYSQAGVLTPAMLAAVFGIPNVLVGEAVTADSDDVTTDVWGNFAQLCWVPPTPSIRVPAFGYTLRRRGYPKSDKYREENVTSEVVRTRDLYVVQLLGADAGYLISNPLTVSAPAGLRATMKASKKKS